MEDIAAKMNSEGSAVTYRRITMIEKPCGCTVRMYISYWLNDDDDGGELNPPNGTTRIPTDSSRLLVIRRTERSMGKKAYI